MPYMAWQNSGMGGGGGPSGNGGDGGNNGGQSQGTEYTLQGTRDAFAHFPLVPESWKDLHLESCH